MSSELRPEDRIVCAALVAGMFLCTACSGDTVEGGDASSTTATTAATTDGEASTGETPDPDELPSPSCDGDVYVGRRTDGGTCGDFVGDQGSWVGASLGTEGVLAAFCEYRWTPVADAKPDLSALPGPTDDVASLAELCPRVIPQAGYFAGDGTLRGLIAAEFMANIGKPSVPMPADRAPVDVRLIDTMPDGLFEKGLMPRSHHGLILRRLAEDMLCTAGDCRASVGNHLGLPRLDEYEVDTERGGFFGNLVELAQGIDEGLVDSEADEPSARRVLVLALGWDGVEDYGAAGVAGAAVSDVVLDPEVPADLQFVIASLARVSCHGALAVAAAGNSTAEPCTQTGPTGPGFLEALPAPDAVACDALGFDHTGVDLGEEHPLVLAATHVTPAGERPANARQGAQATLVAQGAMFGDPDGADEMLRGSSVAATVIGATAAWVWSYYPELTPAQVRQALYTAGTALPGEPAADFPHAAASRQTSICGALIAACELSGAGCADLHACTPAPGADPAIAAHLQSRFEEPCQGDPGCTMPHTMTLGPDFPSNGQTPSACGGDITTWPESDLPPLAPLPPLPWTIPQPGSTMCPTCFVAIPPDGAGIKVGLDFINDVGLPEQLFIHVETATGTYRIAIPVDQLMTDRANIIEIIPPIDWGEVQRVELGYVFKGLGGALQYRSEPLASFNYPCEGGADACLKGKVLQVGTGVYHTCALLSAGKVKCWGGNLLGQLGLGDTDTRGDSPDDMGENLPLVDLGTNVSAVQLAVGGFHTCALLSSGAVKCWGVNSSGALGGSGPGSIGNEPGEMGDALPVVDLGVQTSVMELTATEERTCALFQNGTLKCWGENNSGQLGVGDLVKRGVYASEMGEALPFVDLGVGQTASSVSSGDSHTCMQSPEGLVKCWGEAQFLGLGLPLGILGDQVGEMGDALPFLNLGNDVKAKTVRSGGFHSCALLEGGLLKCWGANPHGQLGVSWGVGGLGDEPGEMGEALQAVDLGAGLLATDLAVSDHSVCALLEGGLVKCWGWNADGQLGLGDTDDRGDGLGEMGEALPFVDTGAAVKSLQRSMSFAHHCALLVDSSVKCWGRNSEGQLGLGDANNRGDDPGEMGGALPRVKLFSSEW